MWMSNLKSNYYINHDNTPFSLYLNKYKQTMNGIAIAKLKLYFRCFLVFCFCLCKYTFKFSTKFPYIQRYTSIEKPYAPKCCRFGGE